MRRFLLPLLALIAIPIAAQVPYIESLEVRVHNVDVVVTDAKGNPVTGLAREDFQILEDGREQAITNFSHFAAAPRASGVAAPADAAAGPVSPPEPPRRFIFFVDEMALTQPAAKKLKAQLDRLLETSMREGDEAMIVRPAQEAKLAQPFSSDRAAVVAALNKAIDDEHWRATSPHFLEMRQLGIEMTDAGGRQGRRFAARRWASYVRDRVQERLGHLRAVVTAAADVKGRKVLVLITESMPLEPGREAFLVAPDPTQSAFEVQTADEGAFGDWSMITDSHKVDWFNLQPLVDEIGRTAATNGITIYALQAEYGIGDLSPDGDIGGTTPGRTAWETPDGKQHVRRASQTLVKDTSSMGSYMMVEARATNTEGTLRRLAEQTGGTWHRGGLAFDNLVDEITSDTASYYSLGYHASSGFDAAHKIEVRVKGHPELHVRTRQEVLRKSPEREMTDRVVASLLTDTPENEVPIRVGYERPAATGKSNLVNLEVKVPLAALAFVPDGDKLKASFTVHYAMSGKDTAFTCGVHGTQVVEIPPSELEKAQSGYWTYVLPLQVRKEKYTVAVGVLDAVTHASGFGRVEVDLR